MSKVKVKEEDLKRDFDLALPDSFLCSYTVSCGLGFNRYYLHHYNDKDLNIPSYKVGNRRLYKKSEVMDWMKGKILSKGFKEASNE